jgi:hypothetical protein
MDLYEQEYCYEVTVDKGINTLVKLECYKAII